MGVMPWSLLKHGLLSGKFRREAGQKLEKRRALTGDWAQFLAGPKVICFREGCLNADFCRSSLSTEVYSIATQKGSRTRRGAVRAPGR
jgi:hypothetical protein